MVRMISTFRYGRGLPAMRGNGVHREDSGGTQSGSQRDRVLAVLRETNRALRVREIVAALEARGDWLPKATLHVILVSLVRRGLARVEGRQGARQYRHA